jgi:hypothetical protein
MLHKKVVNRCVHKLNNKWTVESRISFYLKQKFTFSSNKNKMKGEKYLFIGGNKKSRNFFLLFSYEYFV